MTPTAHHKLEGQLVRHKSLGSLAFVTASKLHTRLASTGHAETYPVLLVVITQPALRSHHKDGDHVIWAVEDVLQ